MVQLMQRLDGFLGRVTFRLLGCVTALMTGLALWAVWQCVAHWDGATSLLSGILFGAGAVLAGWTTRFCFARQRTFGEFIATLEGSDTDTAVSRTNASRRLE